MEKPLTPKMDPQVKEWWVEEGLRSGRYRQGSGLLSPVNEDGKRTYCCLGVLCEVAIAHGVPVERAVFDDHVQYDGEDAFLPESVRRWAGLAEANPYVRALDDDVDGWVKANHGVATLASFNDGGQSFDKIADMIEQNL